MSFRDELSRVKGKLKKRLHIGSRNPTPTPPSPDLSVTLADAPPPAIHRPASASDLLNPTLQQNTANKTIPTLSNTDLAETSTSTQPDLTHPDSTPIPDDTIEPGDESTHQPKEASTAWSGAKTLLAILESSVDAFGPLKSAIGGLARSFDIYERATKGHMDNKELLTKLNQLIDDLRECITGPVGLEMTNSVKRVCTELAAEVQRVEAKLEQTKIRQLAQAMDASDDISECYRRIQSHLERLTLNATMNVLKKVNEQGKAIEAQTNGIERQIKAYNKQEMESRLDRISPALSAAFNSSLSDEIMRGECTPGTRLAQIKFLLQWANDPKSGKTFWMNGMAGTGKTTIAYSVCSQLGESFRLGASFFCSRTISECRQVKNIIPSIAYQLARFSLPFRHALDKVLVSDPDAHTRAIQIQHKQLILEPLSIAQDALPTGLIVVIDALDECENENSLAQVLDVLLSTADTLPIRFLVSSRPEPDIYHRMMKRVEVQGNTRLVLHDLAEDEVKSDVETFMKHELPAPIFPLSESQWTGLITRCGVLFIYASTACRFIKQVHGMISLDEAIDMIINPTGMASSENENDNVIDELYSMILTSAFEKAKPEKARQRMRNFLETVICAVEPMDLTALASVLQLESVQQAQALLQPLRSVINVTAAGIVTTLHASFPDFLFSSDRSKGLHCAAVNRHAMLAGRCLEIIDAVEPKLNICNLSSSYLSDDQVQDIEERVSRSILPSLIYACRYWSTHLYLGGVQHELLVAVVDRFFSERLLLWMEILNLTKRMRFGTGIIRDAERWCQKANVPSELSELVRDAGHFVSVYANHAVSESTPHIYVSMLAFWPRSRPVSVTYMPRAAGILIPTGTAMAQRQPALLATWRLSGRLDSMALSTDGRQIVVATEYAIDMLDTSTGNGIIHLQNTSTEGYKAIAMSPNRDQLAFGTYDGLYLLDVKNEVTRRISKPDSAIYSVGFSSNGSQCAIGLSDTVCLYALQTGELVLGPLHGHTGWVRTLAFSPSGDSLASASFDQTVRVWDVTNGQMIGRALEGHTHFVLSVSYSPDGTRIASASADGTIRVWNPLTGEPTLGPLTEHSDSVRSVTFSPNGAFIASGSADKTIRVYNAKTGQTVLGPLHGHTRSINSVIFSPDSTQLYSCSDDDTIRLWNVQDLNAPTISPPAFPSDFWSVRYSPDGLQVVSGSGDGSVCIWDVKTGNVILGPLQGHSKRVTGVDFSPDGAYIVSASEDDTLRVWSAQDGSDIHGPMQGHTRWVYCVRFSPDGAYLVSGSYDLTVRIWDVATGQPTLEPFKGHSGLVYSVTFSPNGTLVASGSWDDTIRVWDINTGLTVVGPLQGHNSTVSSVEFSPDGSHIISGSWDGSIRLWDAQTGQSLLSWGNNQTAIFSVSFSPDGLLVVSGSDNGTTQIWDAQTGSLLHSLHGHVTSVKSTQFSPDGLHIVSCSSDSVIRFWDVDSRIANQWLNSSQEPGRAHAFIGPTLDPWFLDEKGWITDLQQQRLAWVPEDLRVGLLRYPNDAVICRQGVLKLSFDEVNVGKEWTECYSP